MSVTLVPAARRALIGAALVAAAAGRAQADGYPDRPPHARIERTTGILDAYGRGMRSGSLVLRLRDGTRLGFDLARRVTIDGRLVRCGVPPRDGERADPQLCRDWPPTVVLGRTRVRIDFWRAGDAGERIRITDRIVTLGRATRTSAPSGT